MKVKTEKELAKAIENNENTIEIEGNLKEKVLKIKATGNVAWAIAIGGIGIAVVALVMMPVSTTVPPAAAIEGFIAMGTATAAVGIWGIPTTITAITIAVAAGGVGILNQLRNYKIVEKTDKKLILNKS